MGGLLRSPEAHCVEGSILILQCKYSLEPRTYSFVFPGRLPWLCKCSIIFATPACDEIFYNIALILTPDEAAEVLPITIQILLEDTISRDSTNSQTLGFCSRISKRLLDVRCIRFLQQLSTVEAAFVQNLDKNRVVGYIRIAFPASTIWFLSAYHSYWGQGILTHDWHCLRVYNGTSEHCRSAYWEVFGPVKVNILVRITLLRIDCIPKSHPVTVVLSCPNSFSE